MKMVAPIEITDSMLTSSVPETDYVEWSSSTNYAVGTRVIRASQHKIYECVVAGTGLTAPEVTPSKWLYIAPTNKWACFDKAIGSKTTSNSDINITLTPGVRFDSLVFLGLQASNVSVSVKLPNTAKPNLLGDTTDLTNRYGKWFDPGQYKTIATGTNPSSVAISPDGTSVYVSNKNSGTLSFYNRAPDGSLTFVSSIHSGSGPESIAISPDGTNVYVANKLSNTLKIFERLADGSLTSGSSISTGTSPGSIAISPDGRNVYVANSGYSTLSIFNRFRRDNLSSGFPSTIACNMVPKCVIVSPDGLNVYAVGSSLIKIFNRASNEGGLTLSDTVNTLGVDLSSVAISPDGTRVYTACNQNNYFFSFDRTPNGALRGGLEYGRNLSGPVSIAISPNGKGVYIANYTGNNLYYTGETLGNISSGINPSSVAVSPDGSNVYVTGYLSNTLYIHTRSPTGVLNEGADFTMEKLIDGQVGTFFRITKIKGEYSLRCGPRLVFSGFSDGTYTASVLAKVEDTTSKAFPIYVDTPQPASVSQPTKLGEWQLLSATVTGVNSTDTAFAYLMVSGPIGSFIDVAVPWVENGDRARRGMDDEPYSKNLKLVNTKEPVSNYLSYWLAEFVTLDTVVLTDLPAYYRQAVINIKISSTNGSTVSAGAVLLGKSFSLGDEQYGMSNGITDYSESTTDKFGVTTITERAYAKRMTVSLMVPKANYDSIFLLLTQFRAKPVVWIAGSLASNIIYGYIKDWSGQINYPNFTAINLEIKGLT